jgi:hypothetical protein
VYVVPGPIIASNILGDFGWNLKVIDKV